MSTDGEGGVGMAVANGGDGQLHGVGGEAQTDARGHCGAAGQIADAGGVEVEVGMGGAPGFGPAGALFERVHAAPGQAGAVAGMVGMRVLSVGALIAF